jgi:hypothetical protein
VTTRVSLLSVLACSAIAFQLASLPVARAESPAGGVIDLAPVAPVSPVQATLQRAQLRLPSQSEFSMATGASLAEVPGADASAAAAAPTQEKSGCSWAIEGANSWRCKIQPLTRHDLPLRKTLHHLWPLHAKGSDQ